MKIQLDVFNDDEKQYLNSLMKGRKRESATREDVLTAISFARDVADPTDIMILDLIDGTYSKIHSLTDGEWNELLKLIPFDVTISQDDFTEEVPADEG